MNSIIDAIVNIIYNPAIATVIAFLALFISLYVLYRQLASTPKKRKRKVLISNPAPFFDVYAINKDFLTLGVIIFAVAGIFALYQPYTVFEVKKYVQIGALFLKESVLEEDAQQVASVAVGYVDYGIEIKEEIVGTSTENFEIIEPAKEAVQVKVATVSPTTAEKVATPSVPVAPKPAPPVIIPPAPAVVPEVIKTVEESNITKTAEKPEATGDAPDLTLRILSFYGATLNEGNTLNFSVIVENIGKTDADVSFNTRLFIDHGNDGTINLSMSRLETKTLKVGATDTKIWKSAWVARGGAHRVETCVDSDNTVLEMNEKNNCIDLVLTVEEKETAGDLIIEKVTVDPASPVADDYVSFSVRVKNLGDKMSPVSYTDIRIDGGLLGRIKVPSVGSGTHEDITSAWKATLGSHAYQVCADGKKEILETNEENNCSTGTINIGDTIP